MNKAAMEVADCLRRLVNDNCNRAKAGKEVNWALIHDAQFALQRLAREIAREAS